MLGWLLAALVLLVTIGVGVVVHEMLHAAVLRSGGVSCSVRLRSAGERRGGFQTLATGALASVGIDSIPDTCPSWRLRVAALAPLLMLVPVGAYAVALHQDYVTGSTLASVAVIAWMASALPSPADFAIVWHPEETRELLRDGD